ncbi:protein jag [Spirobacillus cienkowskii]|jgi:spoIIIJ-associated protein|uniref:R3H domain-containing protein n=1 Tax=Spirobacillus cienkowskii TaxID=495820 RepID=A0A369KPC6_9BACT|nr:MAG: hypothetical protein DCC88_04750 [Spirobacillus cienkowskii]
MNKKQYTGKTLEEALDKAARDFAIEKDLVCYNVLQQPSGGLLSRIFNRSIRIEAWVETAKTDLQAAAREVVRQTLGKVTPSKPNLSPFGGNSKTFLGSEHAESSNATNRLILTYADKDVEALFTTYQQLFFSAYDISQETVDIVYQQKENEVRVCVSDARIEKYLSKSDKLSLAFEHVFKRIAQKKLGDVSSRIELDAGISAEKREERLILMAKSLAEKVKKTGKSVILSSKSSQERRVIHLALDGVMGVATRSVGSGDKRRLVIYATEKRYASSGHKKNSSVHRAAPKKFNQDNVAEPNAAPAKFHKKNYKKRPHEMSHEKNADPKRVGAFSKSKSGYEKDIHSHTISGSDRSALDKEE